MHKLTSISYDCSYKQGSKETVDTALALAQAYANTGREEAEGGYFVYPKISDLCRHIRNEKIWTISFFYVALKIIAFVDINFIFTTLSKINL